jgi:hypothetical protein
MSFVNKETGWLYACQLKWFTTESNSLNPTEEDFPEWCPLDEYDVWGAIADSL